jgi:glucose/arabinose dehydrogenase
VVTVVDGLDSPWAMEFLPDGSMLVTEKPGTMQIIGKDGSKRAVAGIPPVDKRQQGGLLDVVLDPAFATNQLIYWSFSEPHPDGTTNTAVARGRLMVDGTPRVENVQIIYHQSPAMPSTLHYGSRLVFARDGTLFVTQGERSIIPGRMQAQKMDSLLGKIARINTDGSVPKDNPFVGQAGKRPEIWNIGNRNVQGAALNPKTGELWTVAHGAQGGDELNISRKGLDYGWPTITYGEDYGGAPIGDGITAHAGMEQPIYYWDPVIAPSGMLFYDGPVAEWKGNLFIAGMIAQGVVRLVLDGDKVVGEERLLTDLKKRVRDVRQGPDGLIYVVTERANGTIYKLVPKA